MLTVQLPFNFKFKLNMSQFAMSSYLDFVKAHPDISESLVDSISQKQKYILVLIDYCGLGEVYQFHHTMGEALCNLRLLGGGKHEIYLSISVSDNILLKESEYEAIIECEQLANNSYAEQELGFKRVEEDTTELAMKEIHEMSAKEFQTRLLNGTLPYVPNSQSPEIAGLPQRDTCHSKHLLSEDDFERGIMNYAEAHRDKLRFMSAQQFKKLCYPEYPEKRIRNSSLLCGNE